MDTVRKIVAKFLDFVLTSSSKKKLAPEVMKPRANVDFRREDYNKTLEIIKSNLTITKGEVYFRIDKKDFDRLGFSEHTIKKVKRGLMAKGFIEKTKKTWRYSLYKAGPTLRNYIFFDKRVVVPNNQASNWTKDETDIVLKHILDNNKISLANVDVKTIQSEMGDSSLLRGGVRNSGAISSKASNLIHIMTSNFSRHNVANNDYLAIIRAFERDPNKIVRYMKRNGSGFYKEFKLKFEPETTSTSIAKNNAKEQLVSNLKKCKPFFKCLETLSDKKLCEYLTETKEFFYMMLEMRYILSFKFAKHKTNKSLNELKYKTKEEYNRLVRVDSSGNEIVLKLGIAKEEFEEAIRENSQEN